MGNHFVPQAYLRSFEDPSRPGFIWVQSRRDEKPRLASIEDVAQSRGFYDAATEELLTSAIEAPANPVLTKLRHGESPAERERSVLAVYIATMIKRVPRHRARAQALAHPTLDSVVVRLREQVQELAEVGELLPELAERRLLELDAAHAMFGRELPPSVVAEMRDPRPTPRIVQALLSINAVASA